jgi:penicillin amidase
MSIRKKFIIAAAGGVAVVILVLILLSVFYLRKTVSYSGSLHGDVKAELQIGRDENGVPHIVADTMEDAYFAVGFLHAQDRFLAVEYFRALANGKISSFTGRSGINVDRLARLIGFSRDARQLFDTLDQESKNNLAAYARGINFFTQKKSGVISGLLQKRVRSGRHMNVNAQYHF